jgi:hypothetical protein
MLNTATFAHCRTCEELPEVIQASADPSEVLMALLVREGHLHDRVTPKGDAGAFQYDFQEKTRQAVHGGSGHTKRLVPAMTGASLFQCLKVRMYS